MRRLFFFLLIVFSSVSAYAANTDFLQLLERRGLPVDEITKSEFVPRGTVAELLNLIDCHDCHHPAATQVQTLSQERWKGFQFYPGKNFDDITYNAAVTQDNNYYCIAYVGNKGYMNGYPRATSPLCSGKFCAALPITVADTIQTIFNISAQGFYGQYNADRTAIEGWLTKQPASIQSVFGLQDLGQIQQGKKNCSSAASAGEGLSSCVLTSFAALQTYAKYCTYQPDSCGMQELPFAKKGQRPIAEMNILLQQGIFTTSELAGMNVEDYAKGSFVLELLGRVKARAQCIDSDDQDKDGVLDNADNCYLTYNPRQSDNDRDTIGNVCDDDVDNDGIKNPRGIIDDNDAVVYSVVPPYLSGTDANGKKNILDNCLLQVNADQKDDDRNGVGNACDIDEKVGLKIQTKTLTKERFVFVAVWSGSLTGFTWYFGDATTGGPSEVISHTYNKAQQYTVRVDGTTPKGKVVSANTTVTVGPSATESLNARANLLPDILVQQVGQKTSYKIPTYGFGPSDVNYISIKRGDGRTRVLAGKDMTSFVDQYPKQGGYTIQGMVYLVDGRSLPIGAYVTVLGGEFCLGFNAGLRAGQCDMDNDAIPDRCDSDIDGDGVTNPLGLIVYETPQCTYGPENTTATPTGGNGAATGSGAGGTGAIRDACPFIFHANQSQCIPGLQGTGTNGDIDDDGIRNIDDACPLIAETINGVNDEDGCPEIDVSVTFPSTKLSAGSCVACPCQYAQDDAGVAAGDRVKAVLFDDVTKKPVAESQRYTVP